MTKRGKHCGKRRNCLFWAISSFVTLFSKSCLLQRCQKASIWGTQFWRKLFWRYLQRKLGFNLSPGSSFSSGFIIACMVIQPLYMSGFQRCPLVTLFIYCPWYKLKHSLLSTLLLLELILWSLCHYSIELV